MPSKSILALAPPLAFSTVRTHTIEFVIKLASLTVYYIHIHHMIGAITGYACDHILYSFVCINGTLCHIAIEPM